MEVSSLLYARYKYQRFFPYARHKYQPSYQIYRPKGTPHDHAPHLDNCIMYTIVSRPPKQFSQINHYSQPRQYLSSSGCIYKSSYVGF